MVQETVMKRELYWPKNGEVEYVLTVQPFHSRELRSYSIGIMRKRNQEEVCIFSVNRHTSLKNLGAMFFCVFCGLVFSHITKRLKS